MMAVFQGPFLERILVVQFDPSLVPLYDLKTFSFPRLAMNFHMA